VEVTERGRGGEGVKGRGGEGERGFGMFFANERQCELVANLM